MTIRLSRRSVLAATAAFPLASILSRRGEAAEITLKLATGQDPSHPVNKRAQEAIARIAEATNGRVEIRLFPANQLGSDTDLIAQLRAGGVDFFNLAASVLATLVPAAGIVNVGFAFTDYGQVWKAMDGELGTYIKSQIEKAGIFAVGRSWNNGFRQVTSSTRPIKTPEDFKGFKMRVPNAPLLTSLFTSLGAGPTPLNFNEVYSALQTKVVEGQENPLPIIATAKLYEVQKYCSLTSHVWDGYWILGNKRSFAALPADVQEVIIREFDRSAADERADTEKLSLTLRDDLAAKGLEFVEVDKSTFRDALRKTTFYKDWQTKFGPDAWKLLENVSGSLS